MSGFADQREPWPGANPALVPRAELVPEGIAPPSVEPVPGVAAPDITDIDASTDRATIIERLKGLDRQDYIVAATVVGASLAAVGGILAARRRGGRVPTPEGREFSIHVDPDRVLKGIASVVEFAGKAGEEGIAVSFPTSKDVAESIRRNSGNDERRLFFMRHKKRTAYPARDAEEIATYRQATGRVASWLIHALSSSDKKDGTDPEA